MSTTITSAFIHEFAAEVKLAYQQFGSKIRNLVRRKDGVKGSKCYFPKIGKGTATQKSRHGNVTPMNPTHTRPSATPEDWFAADYADDLDLLKTNIDERSALASTGAAVLGRKADSLIITALDTASTTVSETAGGLTLSKVLLAFKALNDNDVPDDGNRVCLVGPQQWNNLMTLSQFVNSDFISPQELPWVRGGTAKRWLNTIFLMLNGLTLSAGNRTCHMFHRDAIGLADQKDVTTTIGWIDEKDAYFIKSKMAMGACAIDDDGLVKITCDDSATNVG